MASGSLDRSSLDIQSCTANNQATISRENLRGHHCNSPLLDITRIAVEIGQKSKTVSERDALSNMCFSDSTLDPTSQAFDPRKWAGHILAGANDTRWKHRRASLILKNVTVLGAGCSEEEQENVASVLLRPFQRITHWQRSASRTILRDVNGFLRPGEMLLVLGRPGSGCSSLLKTIACDLSGLTLGENSGLNYTGQSFNRQQV
jgi:ATP-binding cassette subfamily G (WHITE) protein 2 (PDR)